MVSGDVFRAGLSDPPAAALFAEPPAPPRTPLAAPWARRVLRWTLIPHRTPSRPLGRNLAGPAGLLRVRRRGTPPRPGAPGPFPCLENPRPGDEPRGLRSGRVRPSVASGSLTADLGQAQILDAGPPPHEPCQDEVKDHHVYRGDRHVGPVLQQHVHEGAEQEEREQGEFRADVEPRLRGSGEEGGPA